MNELTISKLDEPKKLLSDTIRNPQKVAENILEQKQYFKLWNETEEVKNAVNSSKISNILKSICLAIFQEGFENGVTQCRTRESILPNDFKFTNEVYPESFTILNDLINYREDIKDEYDLGHIRHAMVSASQHIDLMREQNALLHRKINNIKKLIEDLKKQGKATGDLETIFKIASMG